MPAVTVEEYEHTTSEHVSAIGQQITTESSIIGMHDSKDASEQPVLEFGIAGHAKTGGEVDVAGHGAAKESLIDEKSGRHSLDAIPVANQDRLCGPIAQTSEADGDNAAEAAILNSSESLAPAGIEVTDSKAISNGRAEIERLKVATILESQPEKVTTHVVRANGDELTADDPKHEELVVETGVQDALREALVDEVLETHISASNSDSPTIAKDTHFINEVIEANEQITEPAHPIPEARPAFAALTESDALPAQPGEEGIETTAVTTPVVTPVEADEGERILVSPAESGGNSETLPTAAINLEDYETQLLVAVDATKLAAALLVDETAPAIPETTDTRAILMQIQPAELTSTEIGVPRTEQNHTSNEVGVGSMDESRAVIPDTESPVALATETEIVAVEPEVPINPEVQSVQPASTAPEAQQGPTLHEEELVSAEPEVLIEAQAVEPTPPESQMWDKTDRIPTEAEIPTLFTEAQAVGATVDNETPHNEGQAVHMTSTSETEPSTNMIGTADAQVPTEISVPVQGEVLATEAEPVVSHNEVTPAEVDMTIKDTPSAEELAGILEDHLLDIVSIQMDDVIERPKSPWTPSYGIISQGPGEPSPAEKPDESGHDLSEIGAKPLQGEPAPAEDIPKLIINEHIRSPIPLAIDVSLPSLGGEEGTEERPKSPWTPSYSVTMQGSTTHGLDHYNGLDQPPPTTINQLANIHAEAKPLTDSSVALTDVSVDQTDNGDSLNQSTTIPSIDITASEAPPTDSEVLPEANAAEENDSAILAESSTTEDEIVSKLTVDVSTTNLTGEEEARPQSPWTPSYSVTTQGSAMEDAAGLGGLGQLLPSVAIDQPEDVITAEKSELVIDKPLSDVIPGEYYSESILVPAIDITHTDELFQANAAGTVEHGSTSLPCSPPFEDVGSKPDLQLVVDASCTIPSVEQDRPKSPWTTSYSVTTQGSSPHELVDLDQREQLTPCVAEPFGQQATESGATAIHVVPSVDVAQPDVVSLGPVPVEVTTEPTCQCEDAVEDELTVLTSAQPEVMASELKEPVSLVVPVDILGDRPKSPWTPSYSVTTQGPGLHEEDLDHLEQLPERAIDIDSREGLSFAQTNIPAIQAEEFDNASVASDVAEPPLSPRSDLGVFTPSFDTRSEVSAASREPVSPTSSRTDLASLGSDELIVPASLIADRDDITPQYTPLAAFRDVPDMDPDRFARSSEVTPVNECPRAFIGNDSGLQVSPILHGQSPKTLQRKLSLLHLPSVEEDVVANGCSPILELPSATPTRKRLESTTSSRFFPGGWFSSSPILPKEGNTRTSLDVASGEFVQRSSIESRLSTEYPVGDTTSSAKLEHIDDEEKNARWCTIM